MTHAGCRISRVRPKGSKLGEVVILPPVDAAKRRADVLARVRALLEDHGTAPDGWAFVVWDEGMLSSSDFHDARHLMGLPPADDSA